jgi:hypothetical protein
MSEHCPTCGTNLSEFQPPKKTHTLQQWFDEVAQGEYKGMKLLTPRDASTLLGWTWVADDKNPECCGQPVRVYSIIGCPYHAECEKCKKWMHSVTVQQGNSWMSFPPEYVDENTKAQWVVKPAIAIAVASF